MSPTDIQTFAASQLALLEVEHSAEIEETALLTAAHAPIVLQRAGLALLNPQVEHRSILHSTRPSQAASSLNMDSAQEISAPSPSSLKEVRKSVTAK
jgi:hypothetical protein